MHPRRNASPNARRVTGRAPHIKVRLCHCCTKMTLMYNTHLPLPLFLGKTQSSFEYNVHHFVGNYQHQEKVQSVNAGPWKAAAPERHEGQH